MGSVMVSAGNCPMHGFPLFLRVSITEGFNGCCCLPPPDCFGSWSILINHDLSVCFLGLIKYRCFIVVSDANEKEEDEEKKVEVKYEEEEEEEEEEKEKEKEKE